MLGRPPDLPEPTAIWSTTKTRIKGTPPTDPHRLLDRLEAIETETRRIRRRQEIQTFFLLLALIVLTLSILIPTYLTA